MPWDLAQPGDVMKIQPVYSIALSGHHAIVANYSTDAFLKAQGRGSAIQFLNSESL